MITAEDRKTAHELLDQLLTAKEKGDNSNLIIWERAWIDEDECIFHRAPHRTRYQITLKIDQVE